MRLRGMRSDLPRLTNLLVPLVLTMLEAATGVTDAATPVIACVDPKATMVLTDSETVARHDDAWRIAIEKSGRCYRIQPEERWEPVFSAGGLVIMRKTPPQPGIPPLYFRVDGSRPEPAGSQSGSAEESSWDAKRIHPAPVGEVRMETLLPLPALSPPPIPTVALHTVLGDPLPVPPAPEVLPPNPLLDQTSIAREAPTPQPADTPALDRGYALGFGIAIILIVLLLTGVALLLRVLLRPPPETALAPARPSQPGAPLIRLPLLAQMGPEASDQPPADADGPDASAAVTREIPAFVYADAAAPMLPGLVASYAETPASAKPEPEMPHAVQPHGASEAAGQDVATLTVETPRSPPLHVACASVLSEAGWDASIVPSPGGHHADVVARRGGRILALRCLSTMMPVDEDAVEDACMARERERADLGVIVSNGHTTKPARKLAAQAGIDLLREDELPGFVGQARPVT